MPHEANILRPRRGAGLSAREASPAETELQLALRRWSAGSAAGPALDPATREELAALRLESNPALLAEALLQFAQRQEESRPGFAGEIYSTLASDSAVADRARARAEVLAGGGAFGARAESLLRRFAREAADPAMLAAMGGAGLVFRATRFAVLSRLAATPSAHFLTRGFGARAVAGLAGFALEAPTFTLTARAANQALGRSQDWGSSALGRDLASSFLVLGAMKMSGWAGASLQRRVLGPALVENPTLMQRASASLFQQGSLFGGILLGHALEERVGLRPAREGGTLWIDSLATLLQFHVAGRLSGTVFGEGVARWERELDLRTAGLAARGPGPGRRFDFSRFGTKPVLAMAMNGESGAVEPGYEDSSVAGSQTPGSIRPARPRGGDTVLEPGPIEGPMGAERSLKRQLSEAIPLEEAQKRELIARLQSGDRSAENELVRSDLRYANKWARYYGNAFGLDRSQVMDLVQEACLSLVKSAHKFDLGRDNQFLTYATWWIRADLVRYILNKMPEIRVPVHRAEAFRALRRELASLEKQGAEFGSAQVAERLGMTEAEVNDLQADQHAGRTLRMETPLGEEGSLDLHDLLPSDGPGPDFALVGRRLQETLQRFIAERAKVSDRAILEHRLFGEGRVEDSELAERLGMTRGELRSREQRLFKVLRHYLEQRGLKPDGSGRLPDSLHAVRVQRGRPDAVASGTLVEAVTPAREDASGLEPTPAETLRPRIAVIGFGMAGMGATHALRHFRRFSEDPRGFQPEITVFEGMNRVGGKVAPDNLGAQFVDRSHFYPIDRMIADHGLEVTPPRADYDLANFITRSGILLSGARFSRALRTLRQAAREALRTRSWEDLDRESAADFIRGMAEKNGPLDAEEGEAMVSRLGFEEGTLNVSMLSFAINLAKSETPMDRYEVVGGLYRLAEAEGAAVEAGGGRVLTGHPVMGVRSVEQGIQVFFQNREGYPAEETFDYAILALAPEHLRRFEIEGSGMPIGAVASLTPAHILKTHLRSNLPNPDHERATSRYAMWFSPDHSRPDRQPMVTFFHGWNGEPRLSIGEMIQTAYGEGDPEAVVGFESQIWDGSPQQGIPHYYTTMPEPGRGLAMVRFAMDQYFAGRYDAERLKVANHVLGLGCYVRDAALSGEWAAISLLRGMGMSVRRAYERNPRPQRELVGADRIP